jgi:fibronectin-binding autotransporter adhesin
MGKYTGPFTGGYVNSGNTVSEILVSGGTFTGNISNSGTISGAATGIAVVDSSTITGAIIDSGIIAPTKAGVFGISIGGTSNVISGGKSGISVTGPTFTGGIVNAGKVSATDIGIFVGGTNTGHGAGAANVSTFAGGITNSGTVSGGVSGINVYAVESFVGDISNSGTIAATRDSGIYIDNVATFTGKIVNKTGASISGSDSGIVVSNDTLFAGGITNAGAITAGDGEKGIAVYQTPDFTGSIVNTTKGTINGAATSALPASGISVEYGSLFGGGITNSGTITAGIYGINVEEYSTFQGSIINTAGGTISARIAGIDVEYNGTFGGAITNSGAITADGFGIGLYRDQSFGGNIVNATTGTITAGEVGILVSQVGQFGTPNPGGGIVNAGTISVSGFTGQGIFVGARTSFGSSAGISLFAGGITNSGAISATGDNDTGIFVGGRAFTGAQVTISTFSGGIINSAGGTITAGGAGIEVGGVAGGAFEFGTPASVLVSYFSGGITNAGTISGSGEGILVGGTAYSFGNVTIATFSGDIVNSGAISVGGDGILIGGKVLFGFPSSAALNAGVGVATFDGGITNSGVISAGGDGIVIGAGVSSDDGVPEVLPFANVAQFTGNIVNSASVSGISPGGTITGNIGILVTDVGTFTGNIVNGTGASIVAETGSAIEIGARGGNLVYYTSFFGRTTDVATTLPVESFIGSIVNNGTISFSEGPGPFLRAGIQIGTTNGFAVEMQTFSGGITNTGTISVSSTTTNGLILGIYVSGVSHFTGGITNSGTISAHSGNVGTSGSGIVLYYDQTVSGGITNSGDISANFGIGVVNVATFAGDIVNTTSGTIHAGIDGIDVVGPGFTNDSTFLGSIVNQGSITATGVGIEVNGVAQFGSSTAAGNISNTGTITAVTGIYIRAAITSGQTVVDTTMFGSIIDSGDILATKHGIWIGGGATINSTATAVDVTALTFTGGISNSGSLSAVADGIGVSDVATFSGGIVNATGATISAGNYGISVDLFGGDTFTGGITNNGTITGALDGIFVGDGSPKETFLGGIINIGSITATSSNGIEVDDITVFGPGNGGGITNSGTIAAGNVGIGINHVATFYGAVTNTGTITGAIGIDLSLTAGISIFDSGVIDSTGSTAIELNPTSGTDTLTLAAGYTITGNVVGGGSDTLQLGGSSAADFDFNDVGTQYTGFTTFDVIGGTWTTSGSGLDWNVEGGTLQVSDTVTDTTVDSGGTLDILAGGSADPTTVDAGGSETVSAGASDTGANVYGTQYVYGSASDSTVFAGGRVVVENGGTISGAIISGGTVEVVSGGNAGSSITFATNSGTLQIDGPNTPGVLLAGTSISGFVPGDTIDLTGIDYSTPNSAFVNGSDQLQITEGGNTYEIQLTGDFTGDTFNLAPDNGGAGSGTEITETPCYCPGTLIKTKRGQKKVEKLKIGDQVMTASGVTRPIKWIGKRSYGGRFVMGRKDILPICIKAGALDDNVPHRDLWISPNHAMYLDGVLIEAKDLINGVSVVRAPSVESIEYFHVELETHDVIIAEGALAESFIDDDSRFLFHNAREYRALYPAAVTTIAQYCAPRLQDGYEVEAVWRRLAARAGLASAGEETRAGNLRGYVDRITGECVSGWAQNVDHPEVPVCLDIVVGGVLAAQILANHYREDLQKAGMGSGRHSFEFRLPEELVVAADEVEVRRSLDGVALELTIEAWRMLRQSTARRRAA